MITSTKLFFSGFAVVFLLSVATPVAQADFWGRLLDSTTGQGSLFGSPSEPAPDRGAIDDISGALGQVGGEAFDKNLVDRVNSNSGFFQDAFGRVVGIFFSLAGTVFLIMMLYGGFQWMSAQGNSEQVDAARNVIVRGLIGVGIVFAAFAITYTIAYIYFRVTSPPHVQTFIAPQQSAPGSFDEFFYPPTP